MGFLRPFLQCLRGGVGIDGDGDGDGDGEWWWGGFRVYLGDLTKLERPCHSLWAVNTRLIRET